MNKNEECFNCNNFTNYYIIKFVAAVFIFINFILCWFLIGEFRNNKIFSEYKDNWRMVPIKSISLIDNPHLHFNKKNKDLDEVQKRLGYFPGIKEDEEENLREIKGSDITIWGNSQFNIELMDKEYKYYDLLKKDSNKIFCGTDENGNNLYFPNDKINPCPINYISITDNVKDDNCGNNKCKTIQLNNGKYLHFSNVLNKKILVQFYISNFCDYFKNCNSKNDIEQFDDYEILDEENINEVIKQNGYLLSNKYFNSSGSIKLRYRSFIDIENLYSNKQSHKIKKYMKYLINFQKYCNIKIIFFIIFNLIIAIFFVSTFFSTYRASFCYFVILFFVLIRCILSGITIGYFDQMRKQLFKYTIRLKYIYKNNNDSKSMRIEEALFIFDQCIFVLIFILFIFDFEVFKALNEHPIEISFLKGENLKKLIKKTFCCEVEELNEKTINKDLLIDSDFKKKLLDAKDDEKKLSQIYNELINHYIEEAQKEGENNEGDQVKQALYQENFSQQIHFSQMNTSVFNFGNEQRKGGFGGVKRFQLMNTNREFALKTANQETSDEKKTPSQLIKRIMNIKFLEREINFLKQLNHPNIIKYYGTRIRDDEPQMVMEFANGGSLDDLLKEKNENNEILPIKFKLKLMKELASALNYIHGLNIIHCDLKTLNILLDKKFENGQNPNEYPNLKLIDFGLSCNINEQVPGYSLVYTAPEILNKKNLKAEPSLDVYYFGSVCYEILVQKRPFYEINSLHIIKYNIKTGKTPDLTAIKIDKDYNEIIDIIKDCWKFEPKNRPNMKIILEKLNNL